MARRNAFTLIELLVVIAIIAILAAILFPVFAQAKDSAKNTQTLSNFKQTATAALMYCGDYEDVFPLTVGSDAFKYEMWHDTLQPYMKNYELLLHPKRPRPNGPTPTHMAWQRTQYVGCFPTVASNGLASLRTRGYYQWAHATITGGQNARFDGLFGHGGDVSQWYGQVDSPSRSQTSIAAVAETALFSEAANWDNWWSFNDGAESYAFRYGVKWTPVEWSSFGNDWGFAGPLAMTRPKPGLSGIPLARPDGISTIVWADGHAKAMDNRGQLLKTAKLADGVTTVLKHFWPNGI
jgi:prepilin-type N-terminal cleavage/methylation domain-containing protein